MSIEGICIGRTSRRAKAAGIAFVVLWFVLGGMAHFLVTDLEVRIVPPYIPWPREVVLVTGFFELLGAAGLLWKATRRAAGVGLLVLTLAVTPAHFYMLQQPDLFAIPYWMLVLRIPLQVVLLVLIAWSSLAPASGPRLHSR
ncbi:MAG: hypothetical protein ABI607_11075 [Betaproteobacteria bacterium]